MKVVPPTPAVAVWSGLVQSCRVLEALVAEAVHNLPEALRAPAPAESMPAESTPAKPAAPARPVAPPLPVDEVLQVIGRLVQQRHRPPSNDQVAAALGLDGPRAFRAVDAVRRAGFVRRYRGDVFLTVEGQARLMALREEAARPMAEGTVA